MPPPNWIPGQVLVASDVNSWFVPETAYKTADLSRASQTSPSNDPDLTVTLDATAVYAVQFAAMYACAATSGTVNMGFQFAVPAGATGEYVHWYWSGATTFAGPGNAADLWTQGRIAYAAAAGDHGITGHGTIFTTTSGALIFQWAQGTTSATGVTLRKGSHLVAQRIG